MVWEKLYPCVVSIEDQFLVGMFHLGDQVIFKESFGIRIEYNINKTRNTS